MERKRHQNYRKTFPETLKKVKKSLRDFIQQQDILIEYGTAW